MKISLVLRSVSLVSVASLLLACSTGDSQSLFSSDAAEAPEPLTLRLYTDAGHSTEYAGPVTAYIYGDDNQTIVETIELSNGSELQLDVDGPELSFTLVYEAPDPAIEETASQNKQLLHSFLNLNMERLRNNQGVAVLNINTRRTWEQSPVLASNVRVNAASQSLPPAPEGAPTYYQLNVDYGDLQSFRAPEIGFSGFSTQLEPDCPMSFLNGTESLMSSSVLRTSDADEQSILAMVSNPVSMEQFKYGYLLDQSIEDNQVVDIALEHTPEPLEINQQGFSLPLPDGSLASNLWAMVTVVGARNERHYRLNLSGQSFLFGGESSEVLSECSGTVNEPRMLQTVQVANGFPADAYYRRSYLSAAQATEILQSEEGFGPHFIGSSCLRVDAHDPNTTAVNLDPAFVSVRSAEYDSDLNILKWDADYEPSQLQWMTARLWPQGSEDPVSEDYWLIEFDPREEELELPGLPETIADNFSNLSPRGAYRLKLGFYDYLPTAGELPFEYSLQDAERERQFCEGFSWRIVQAPIG